MSLYIYIVFGLGVLSAVVYTIIISRFTIGWFKLPFYKSCDKMPHIPVSIIIAARNESAFIGACLSSIITQKYPKHLFEIIVVEDNSTDDTAAIVENFMTNHDNYNIRLIRLSNHYKEGKKEAVFQGVCAASNDLIITTDADCVCKENWVQHIVCYYNTHKPKLICAPVLYYKLPGFFHKFQEFDFLSLILSGAGAISNHNAFMGNAANMAFEKQTFLDSLIKRTDLDEASGDDVYLIHYVKTLYKKGIHFIKSNEAVVYTLPKQNMDDLINQRIRWGSKTKHYNDFKAMLYAASVFDFNFLIVISFFLGILKPVFFVMFAFLLLLKIIIDLPLLFNGSLFFKKTYLLKHYLWIQCVYPFYLSYVAMGALFSTSYYWKGRKIK